MHQCVVDTICTLKGTNGLVKQQIDIANGKIR